MNRPVHANRSRALPAIFWAGFTCGLMDISAAFITWWPKGILPSRILQGIASGLLGPDAYNRGCPTAALGLALHFFIAFSAAAVFYLASRKLSYLTQHPVLSGALYGVSVYLVMYWIVMPLSRYRHRPFTLSSTTIAIVTHIICVGLPISLIIAHYSRD
jgi:zinc transporter ZupT